MQRFTISLDDALAAQFDALIAGLGYENRSEAVRDLIRARLGLSAVAAPEAANAPPAAVAPWCVAVVSFVYDHHDRTVAARLLDAQHDHHDLVITSQHAHLDHADCLETVLLRGPSAAVQSFAQKLVALRGVRHGQLHLVPLVDAGTAMHCHDTEPPAPHSHRRALN